ncbi:zinc metallopeptidase [Porcipelethomonas sp.]|uniref:zinc metallopeptidase n=1 Tax=Porcipelethomonas sp. TaxID=2981675 RepID=UPI003EF9D40B
MFFYDYYWLALIPLIIAMLASANVKSTYSKYEKVRNGRGLTGAMAAREILDANGLSHIRIEHVSGQLSDHFDPRSNVVRLSDSTYNSASVAAVGVAAHEVGHALQYANNYTPMKLRSAIIPLTNIGSSLSYPLVLIGIIMGNSYMGEFLVNIGIILFLTVVVFQFATLFVEFNASSRAMKTLENYHMLEGNELKMSRKVLTAAALTYVAALFTAIVNLIRLLLIASNRNRNGRD